jgi:DNA-binding response OmpR family regulator
MSGTSAKILVLEDNTVEAMLVQQTVKKALPQSTIMRAATIEEAQDLLSEYEVDLFILDVNLPDGSGIDFLCDVQTVNPGCKAIIVTADPLPEHRQTAQSLGVLRFMEKPIDTAAFQQVIRGLMEAEVGEPEMQFRGALSNLTPMDIMQLKCLAHATVTLEFVSGGERGRIYINEGQIVHAETGQLAGTEALTMILGWKSGNVNEQKEGYTGVPTLEGDWQGLLLNAMQEVDEAAGS